MSFELDDVGLTHANGFVALSGISLRAAQGESMALIGPSGAGKTSLLSAIGTAHLRSAGQIVRVKFCRNFGLNHFQLRFTARLSCIGGIEREWG